LETGGTVVRFLICVLIAAASLAYGDETEQRIHKSVKIGAATRVVLNADSGSIQAHPGGKGTAEFDVLFRGNARSQAEMDRVLRDFTLDVEQFGTELRVTGRFRDGRKPYLSGPGSLLSWLFGGSTWLERVEYDVALPPQLMAVLNTSGGGISVDGMKNDVNVHTSGGSIQIEDVGGAVNASTSGGTIAIDEVGGHVNAHTSGGSLRLHNLQNGADASTSGGSVTASFSAQPLKDCRLTTSGGGINVTLGRDVHVDLDASSSGGGVVTDFPVVYEDRNRNHLRTGLNGGGPLLYLHTSGGGISVRHLGTAAEREHGRSAVN
jgi:hypothetical protein